MQFERAHDLPKPGEVSPARDGWAIANDLQLDQWEVHQRGVMVDIDGILFPFHKPYGLSLRGEPFSIDDIGEWNDWPGEWNADEKEQAMMFAHSADALGQFGFYAEGIEQIAKLREHGVIVHIVSRREPHLQVALEEALLAQNVTVDSVYCGRKIDKVAWCLDNQVGVMVDDKPSTIEAGAAANLSVLSLHWPYNAYLQGESNVLLTQDWSQLGDAIMATLVSRYAQ